MFKKTLTLNLKYFLNNYIGNLFTDISPQITLSPIENTKTDSIELIFNIFNYKIQKTLDNLSDNWIVKKKNKNITIISINLLDLIPFLQEKLHKDISDYIILEDNLINFILD